MTQLNSGGRRHERHNPRELLESMSFSHCQTDKRPAMDLVGSGLAAATLDMPRELPIEAGDLSHSQE